jgi:molybdopterin synthase sulfur carrier subunit
MKILYFAWLRERIGRGEEEVVLPEHVHTVADLMGWLKSRGEEFSTALEHDAIVRVAIDRRHVGDRQTSIAGASEIALFPPMTGG